MFEKSPTWQRFSSPAPKVIRVHLGYVPELDDDRRSEKTGLRIALAAAVLFHVGLFLVHLPDLLREADWQTGQQKVFVVQPVRFEPPPPAQSQQLPKPKEKRRTVPVPDPTPDDPEPIRVEEVEWPEVEIADLTLGLGIPDAPPLLARGGSGRGPFQVGGDVTPPVKVYYPSPPYTEEARQSRIQGVVILEAIIDALGNVSDVRVLKGLPDGLSESAVTAARSWRFEPARRNGSPVPVFFNLTIRFSLQ